MSDENKLITVDKEELQKVLVEKQKVAIEKAGILWTEKLEDIVKGKIQDALADQPGDKKAMKLSGRDDPKGGFRNLGEFASDVIQFGINGDRGYSEKLRSWDKVSKALGSPSMGTTSGEDGGFLIPTEFSTNVLMPVFEQNEILKSALVVPMQGQKIDIPMIKGFDRSQGKVAGNVAFEWVAELDNRGTNGQQVKLDQVELVLREANAMVYLNNSLIKFSAVSIPPFINRAMAEAFKFTLNDVFIDGTGVGQPQGVLNSNALVTVGAETDQVANTIETANILNMYARHHSTRGEWWANRNTLPQLAQMTLTGGTASTPVFMPAGGLSVKPFPTLMGDQLVWSEHNKTLGTVGDILLADWSNYLVGVPAGGAAMEMAESIHLNFDRNQKALRFTFYVDGQVWWPEVATPKHGDTKSPFVVLATRS